ncbi:phage tail tape measure protein [Salibacterium salarium]|nr:phage tail tape measure protein [Salibacterium salarium]
MTDINRKLRGLNSEFKANTAGSDEYDKSLKGLRTRSDYLNDTLTLQRTRMEQLKREYDKSVQTKGRDAKETENLAIRYNNASKSMQRTEKQLGDVNADIDKQTDSWRKLGGQIEDLQGPLQGIGSTLQDVGTGLTAGVTAPMLGAGAAAGTMANDFDQAQGRLQAQLGATAERAENLADIGQDLWENAFGQSVEEATGAVARADQYLQDLSDEQLREVSEQAFILRDTFDYDIQESLRSARTLVTNFGVEGAEAFDYITRAAQESGDYSQDLLDTINEYSPNFKAAGMDINNMFDILMRGADAGAWNMDKVADSVREFNTRAQDGSKATNEAFERIGFNAEDMAQKMAEGGDDGEKAFMATVSALAAMEDPLERNKAGVDLFGSMWEDLEGDVITSLAGAESKLGDVEGATKKAGDAVYDNFGTRATEVWREFQSDLEPVGEIVLELAEEWLPKLADGLEEVTGWFNNLSEEGQKTVLAIGGIGAAAGPAIATLGTFSMGLGSLAGAAGKVVKGLGGRAGIAGAARAIPGPVGIAATAVLGLGTAAWKVNEAMQENKEVNLEAAETMQNNIGTLDQQVERWRSLDDANKLTNDEMLQFIDNQKELEEVTDPETIMRLQQEQDNLQAKSGLSNDQLNKFIDVNKRITDQVPGVTGEIGKYGDVYIDNMDKVEQYNDSQREALRLELEAQKENAEDKKAENLKEYKNLQDEVNERVSKRSDLSDELQQKEEALEEAQKRKNEEWAKTGELNAQERAETQNALKDARDEYDTAKLIYETNQDDLQTARESLSTTGQELGELDNVYRKLIDIELEQAGYNTKKGEGLQTVKDEISELQAKKASLELNTNESTKQTQSYRDQIAEIEGQISQLDGVRDSIVDLQDESEELNSVLSGDVNKEVTIDYIENKPAGGVPGVVNSNIDRVLSNVEGYATGTDSAPGGAAIVGEEGPELVNLPKGAQVFTADETKRMQREMPREFQAAGVSLSSNLAAGIDSGISAVSTSVSNVMDEAKDTADQYSGKETGKRFVSSIVEGIQEEESMSDVNISSLVSGAREASMAGPNRSAIQKTRDIRDSNIQLLEQEISLLEQEGASQDDLNKAKEKQAELDALRSQKAQEYQNRIRDEQAILKELKQAYEEGNITQSHYNQAVAEITTNMNDLRVEASQLNQTIGEEQAEALRESEQAMKEKEQAIEEQQQKLKEYAREAANAFQSTANDQMNAYDTAMEEQAQALQEKTQKAIDSFNAETDAYLEELSKQEEETLNSFDRQTEAHEQATNRQIENIKRKREEEIGAIDDQLSNMDEEDQQYDRDQQRAEWDTQRGDMEHRLEVARFMGDQDTEDEVKKERKELEDEIADQQREWERSDKRDALKAEQERIKEEAALRVEEKENELADYQEKRENEREHLEKKFTQRQEAYEKERARELERLEEERAREEEVFQQDYEKQQERFTALSEQLTQHVADGKMTQEQANAAWLQAVEDVGNEEVAQQIENQERTKEELNKYVEDYVNIGESYGDGMIDGLVGTLKDRLSEVKSAASNLTDSSSESNSNNSRGGGGSSDSSNDDYDPLDPVRDAHPENYENDDDPIMAYDKFHDGGWVGKAMQGLKGNEIPAILEKGEFVLSKKMLSAIGSAEPNFPDMDKIGDAIASHMPQQQSQPVYVYIGNEQITDFVMTDAMGQSKQTSRQRGGN